MLRVKNLMSSSDSPLIGYATEVVYLEDGEYGWVKKDEISLFMDEEPVIPTFATLGRDKLYAQKMVTDSLWKKRSTSNQSVVSETLMGRTNDESVELDELKDMDFSDIDAIKICACGTSYHAGLTAAYLFERISKMRCQVEIASEFRYKEPLLDKKTLFLVISQSGETADTLEALKMAKKAGMKTLAICNVDNSSIVRLSDATLLTRAGIEKGVASTKAFATQIITLWLLALCAAKKKKQFQKKKCKVR